MSKNEQPNLPIELNLLDENKTIVVLNKEHQSIEEHIKKELEADKYNSIVTIENYKSMEDSATELNKTSNFISNFRIAKKKSEMTHIDKFEENLKGYCLLIQAKRETILKGISVFKEKNKEEVKTVCKEYLKVQIKQTGLRKEFANINVSDMILNRYMTPKGLIAKPGKDEVEKRVNEKLALQNKVDNRILSLENQCLKAGIEPLTVEHIQGFLYADDEEYDNKLLDLIDAEEKRMQRIREQAKLKAEKEATEKVVREQKALKDELHARYESAIKMADMPNLTRINLELRSYDDSATYQLRQLSSQRETELLEPKQEEVQEVDETQQQEHLKAIQKEVVDAEIKEEYEKIPLKPDENGKVEKTLSIKIRVPADATDEQVIGAVIRMIKADRFPIENIEVN